jgi:hypothetical protein
LLLLVLLLDAAVVGCSRQMLLLLARPRCCSCWLPCALSSACKLLQQVRPLQHLHPQLQALLH